MSLTSNQQVVKDQTIVDGENNKISAVVVFTDKAYVHREARVQVKPGINRLLVEVLAFSIDQDSVQAGIRGYGEILGVQYKEVPVKEAPQEEVLRLENEKERFVKERKVFQVEREMFDKKIKFLDSIIEFSETELPKEIKTQFPDVERLSGVLAFLEQSYLDILAKDSKLGEKIDDLNREIAVVDKELKQLKRPVAARPSRFYSTPKKSRRSLSMCPMWPCPLPGHRSTKLIFHWIFPVST